MAKQKQYKCKTCKESTPYDECVEEIHDKTRYRWCKKCYELELIKRAENQDWINLYEYVRREVWKLPHDRPLPPHFINRIKSLRFGRYLMRGRKVTQSYTYKQMYYTFLVCNKNIQDAFKRMDFSDDTHKVDYMMAIIVNNINGVCDRIDNKERCDDELQVKQVESLAQPKSEFVNKTKTKFDELF